MAAYKDEKQHFLMKEGSDLDMTFSEFVAAYTRDMQPKRKHNTWLMKEHIVRTKPANKSQVLFGRF